MPSEEADDYWDNILEQGVDDMEEAPDYTQIHETVVSDAEPTAHDVQPKEAPSLAEERDVLRHDMDDIKPIEVEQSSVAVELSDEAAVPYLRLRGRNCTVFRLFPS